MSGDTIPHSTQDIPEKMIDIDEPTGDQSPELNRDTHLQLDQSPNKVTHQDIARAILAGQIKR